MTTDERRTKELKVSIPTELHLMLLRQKIVHGRTIASTVEAALRAYFTEMEQAREAEGHHEVPAAAHEPQG